MSDFENMRIDARMALATYESSVAAYGNEAAHFSIKNVHDVTAYIDRLEAALLKAEQRGYANARDEERKLHEGRIEELESALRVAAGYISTKEGHTDQHPQDVYDWIVSVALGEKKNG